MRPSSVVEVAVDHSQQASLRGEAADRRAAADEAAVHLHQVEKPGIVAGYD
jgi:hypothetical protein